MVGFLLLLGVQAVVGVVLPFPADLLEVAYLGALVASVFKSLAFLFSNFSGCSGSVPGLSTPTTFLVTGGLRIRSESLSPRVLPSFVIR